MADRMVELRQGRSAGVQAFGDPLSQRTVVLCHAAPGSCVFDPDPVATDGWGVQLLAIDRPGYGASPPLPDGIAPSIADRADDLAEYVKVIRAEAMGNGTEGPQHVGVVGWSTGGLVALALAARHPNLVDRLAIIAAPAPESAIPWMAPRLAEVTAALLTRSPADAKAQLRSVLVESGEGAAAGPEQVGAAEADDDVLQVPGVRQRLERMLAEAYRQGPVGLADDLLAVAADDWGFDPRSVAAKTLLVYGGADAVTGSAHGRWYRKRVKHARLKVVPGAGHLVVVNAWRDVLEHVAPEHYDE